MTLLMPFLRRLKNAYNTSMTILASKKEAQEHLQEVRHPHKDSIRYRKRKQEEKEAEKAAKEDLRLLKESGNAPIQKIY